MKMKGCIASAILAAILLLPQWASAFDGRERTVTSVRRAPGPGAGTSGA